MSDFRLDTILFGCTDIAAVDESRVNEVIISLDATLVTAKEKRRSERRQQKKMKQQECGMCGIVCIRV